MSEMETPPLSLQQALTALFGLASVLSSPFMYFLGRRKEAAESRKMDAEARKFDAETQQIKTEVIREVLEQYESIVHRQNEDLRIAYQRISDLEWERRHPRRLPPGEPAPRG